jgi:hypothetical protein
VLARNIQGRISHKDSEEQNEIFVAGDDEQAELIRGEEEAAV